MKRIARSLLLSFVLCAALIVSVWAANASPTASKVLVNSAEKSFDAYNIDGNNYFKLRDIAYVLNGTSKQFEVTWDGEKNAINLQSGKPYTAVGGEMTGKGAGSQAASPTSSKIYLDGAEIALTAYHIGGNNYFKLRDLGSVLDFGIGWDGTKNLITVVSANAYYTRKYELDGGRYLAEFVNGTLAYLKGSFWEGSLFDDFEYTDAEQYRYNIINAQGAVLETLPYQHVEQLSNGYFRALYDIVRDTQEQETIRADSDTYQVSDVTVVTNHYLSGKVVYLDKGGRLLNDKVYDAGYDFIGGIAIAERGDDYVLLSEAGEELIRVTGGGFQITSDGKYYISGWGTYQNESYAALVTDAKGQLLFKDENHSADYINNGCFVRSAQEHQYVIYDIEAGKALSDRSFDYVHTFDSHGLVRFAAAQANPQDTWRAPVMYGLMNRQGQILIEADTFAYIGRFNDGRAVAMRGGATGNDAGYGGTGEYMIILYPSVKTPVYDPDSWADRPMSWSENWADRPDGGVWEWIDQNGNKLGVPTGEELAAEIEASGLLSYTP